MITISIVGASGYSGAELMRLLSFRPDVSIKHVVAYTSLGKHVRELYPSLSGRVDLEFEPIESIRAGDSDLIFIALPSGEAMNIVPRLQSLTERIIDLGGDFRLHSANLYEQYYHKPHTAHHLAAGAVYGLPEINREAIFRAQLVANPGCYPTSAILGLLPALESFIISPEGIVINSLSGTSGAGKSTSLDMSFSEINENIRAYKIGVHQHSPEIKQCLEQASGRACSFTFVPHLIPITRGIYTTIYADLQRPVTQEEYYNLYREYYSGKPFVRVRQNIPQVKDVLYTNFCDVGFAIDETSQKLVIISVIDNLVKGAAGQAIQNMNIMFGLPETQGFFPVSVTDQLIKENIYVS